jgi:hypothetical protein
MSVPSSAFRVQYSSFRVRLRAVSRKPIAVHALVYELYGLTEGEFRIVEGEGAR